ncbi:MAG: hypothetical protein ACR2PL_01915 [Dehalococcoidia bacterium]
MVADATQTQDWPLTREEAWQVFDRQVCRSLSMSAEEFLAVWDAGRYEDPDQQPEVAWIASLLPLVR